MIRRAILKWLFGAEIDSFIKLIRRYEELISELQKERESHIESLYKLKEQCDSHRETINIAKEYLNKYYDLVDKECDE